VLAPVGKLISQVAVWSTHLPLFGRGSALATGSCKQVRAHSRAALDSVARLSSTFFSLEESPSPKRKVKRRGGSCFPLFLIKCHLLSVKQPSVSCSALGQINI
jgi:hypothetical protein